MNLEDVVESVSELAVLPAEVLVDVVETGGGVTRQSELGEVTGQGGL